MTRSSKMCRNEFTVQMILFLVLLVACNIGCGSSSRDDFKGSSTKAEAQRTQIAAPEPTRPLPQMVVGQTYALTTIASEKSPSRTFTGVLKSSSDESVVLASPVKQSASKQQGGDSIAELNDEIIREDVTLNCNQIRGISMMFSTMTN